jgi:hypothetical protein
MICENGALGHRLVDHFEGNTLGDDLPQERPTDGGVHDLRTLVTLAVLAEEHLADTHLGPRLKVCLAAYVGAVHLADVRKHASFTAHRHTLAGHVVETQYHVLRRHDDRLAVAGDRMLFVDIISARASSWASSVRGT